MISTVNTDMVFNNSLPIYLQVKNYFINLIKTGSLKENDPLPSIREVAVFFNINPNTVMRSFDKLVKEGYIVSLPKKGFFVLEVVEDSQKDYLVNSIKDLLSKGYTYEEIEKVLKENIDCDKDI